ncbi:MAG: glycosyltransferase family 4 protein [Actinomycetales bacterium]|jgi:glycosyltransferase involved in cell wall biosynthesis|uniref:D-inositol 3-phosphate glycosyltransferase n=1 Tax=Candidatus Phosphoribacter hodrii TaxID=2953743 RepID=A0A935M6J4_9MICO|nr:glycosyltransferase family 4 protein [Candidatus Phosphoribacter hodrii]MBP8837294.1 glycosyltransferase family 4 protein [Dermatophilaceae bacterium]OPZ56869.1 MAG: GDP-mannose-dependent alpha-(1-6)-phosphatidylinositol monomannoside mannosyltransferase [bacterium ADurb.BinA028]MBL0005186.1 glycosyltransferase family 4 protein [Candidatus Phosphoribacter hodrii]MBP8880964.1 glycosyltransferase family 4 protein [Dermatophilaceae bacterium]
MRIVVVNNFFPPRVGGSSHLSDALARGYAARAHEVLVVTAAYGEAPAQEQRDGIRIVRFPAAMLPETRFAVSFDLSFASRPSLPRDLARLLDDFRPDVIHQHGQFMDLTWATGAYARRRGIPVLLSVHTRLENPAALYRHAFRTLDATLVAPRLRRYRPRIVVMDAHMRDYITARYRGGYRELVPIPVGVDPVWVRGGDAAVGRELAGVGDAPILLSVGHVIPLRDRVGLVEALPAVLARHPDARLVVAGRVYYDVFLRRATELGVAYAVRPLGAVPKASIPHLLAAATLESHEQGDGMGTATLEAMAAGVPIVGWGRLDNFPGVPLHDGGEVLLTDRGDVVGLAQRLLRVLDDPVEAQAVGARGRALIDAHFTLDRVLDAHLATFSELLGRA